MCEPLRRRTVDSTASLCSVLQTLRNDEIELIVRCSSGSLIARLRIPCAFQKTGARAWSARACDLRAAAVADARFERM
eukprot:11163280-Lingulodinium_polyedra.AAC.1